jgi:hypothetical protein
MGKHTDDTCFLFADPSFLLGVASVLDIGGTLVVYNTSKDSGEADTRALASDWASVGRDIRTAIEKFEQEKEKK